MAVYQGNQLISGGGYPSQDGQAGRFLSTNGTSVSWDNPYRPPMFTPIWSDHLLNDIQYLRADTFSWQDGTVYTAAYNTLVEEYNASTSEEETEGGTQNFTVVGSPTITSNIVSGFSTSNYLQYPSNFQPSTSAWEMKFKIKTGSDVTTEQYITSIQKGSTNANRYATRLWIDSSSHFNMSVTYNGTAWDIVGGTTSGATGTYTVLANTTYYIKFQYTGSAYTVSYSLDNRTYTTDCSVASTTPMYNSCTYCIIGAWNNGSVLSPFLGSIDLSQTYIKIDDSYWWLPYADAITFRRTANGFKIATATSENTILSRYNSDGRAWFYILDEENIRFKLPRTKYGFEGLRDSVGDDINQTLPNITGYHAGVYNGANCGGALYGTYGSEGTGGAVVSASYKAQLKFDASRSSSVYQNGANVQENATQMYLYFYIGFYTPTAVAQTAGMNSEQLNAKVDVSSLVEVNPMIVTYVNGTSGYNIWANGYCEQWGCYGNSSSYIAADSSFSITFAKTFLNTNYGLTTNASGNSGTTSGATAGAVQEIMANRTTSGTSFTTDGLYSSFTRLIYWRVFGYLAEGQY